MAARADLFSSVSQDNSLAMHAIEALVEGDDIGLSQESFDAEAVCTMLDLLGIRGGGLAQIWVRLGRDPCKLTLLAEYCHNGLLPAHVLRDAAQGLPVDLEDWIRRLREVDALVAL
jgi:hypothetical protein